MVGSRALPKNFVFSLELVFDVVPVFIGLFFKEYVDGIDVCYCVKFT